ncbi:Crp/Fnr family transcriptional regulator [Pedobacter rhizosphaerae]|uniref:Cyclic nucleotide-binding domain-containing protein n=1 Tax=Pedobacter rhizosphaerae TaxID=390241 RepID=A0A1H9T187_9SPHI|nr:cyclic nucleotide-binding domain-containing protein [Pedobacter rhizosphaerae]SER90837.1 Cyclic nucleotide-binding domain-containing protein [Pedobacter rhizosphaerae]
METFLILSGALNTALREILLEVTLKKGTYILTAGSKQPHLWFILEGLLREITVDRYTQQTHTSWFWFNNSFVYAMPGFFDQAHSSVSIEVVKDTKVLLLSYPQCWELRTRFEQADLLFESIRSRYGLARKNHLKKILSIDTLSRYLAHQKQLNILFQLFD